MTIRSPKRSGYERSPLGNPANDTKAIAVELKAAGFELARKLNPLALYRA